MRAARCAEGGSILLSVIRCSMSSNTTGSEDSRHMTPDHFSHLLDQYDTRQISLRSIEEGWDDIVKPETGISVQKDLNKIGNKISHSISVDYDDVRIIKDTQASLVFL